MPLLLARIDDRLIHGQVAHGWGNTLHPTLLAIVSDSLRAEPDRADLYLCGVPEGARGRVVSVAEALDPAFQNEVDAERTILLLTGPKDALRLLTGGFPLRELNLGGLHHAPGRREMLPYVFLDDADREQLRELQRRGVRVYAQDLPSNSSHAIDAWLGGAT